MKRIVHLISNDKFTSGYINFFKMKLPLYEHHFLVMKGEYSLALCDNENVITDIDYKNVKQNRKVCSVVSDCDKLIVTGLFSSQLVLFQFPKKVLKKTYIQFWGGDFYEFRESGSDTSFKHRLNRRVKYYCMKNCTAFIFLIEGEYDKFVDIVGIEKKHFTATVPFDPYNSLDYDPYIKEISSEKAILLGNSATRSNRHILTMELLKSNTALENISVYCPLSYGDNDYGKEVAKKGEELFGSLFHPVLDFLDKEKYAELMQRCSVGVFNNDRQQAMGNIIRMLRIGRKVYIDSDTSMWGSYTQRGFTVFPVESIKNMSYEEFFYIDPAIREMNISLAAKEFDLTADKEAWSIVLNDELNI